MGLVRRLGGELISTSYLLARVQESALACAGHGLLYSIPGCRTLQTALTRNPNYSDLKSEDISAFRGIVGEANVITAPDNLERYNKDWLGKYQGHSQVALRPKTTQQVADILSHCTARRLAVVPQGGNTGLVGGSVPVFDEVILSMSSMDRLISFDKVSGAMVAEAGAILQQLDEAAVADGFTMPLDLGAKGSCQIGGNVSTNAGGIRLLRYGSLHGSVLGLEVVLADGSVLDLLKTLRKDNTGYDLKQMFIGAEGTLGVVTKVAIQCAPRPRAVQLAFLAVPSFEAVQEVLRRSREMLGEILSACEFMDEASMELVLGHTMGTRHPLPGSRSPFYMLIETSGSNEEHDEEKLSQLLQASMEDGLVEDGTLAQDTAQARAFWHVREGMSEALQRRGAVYKYDLSMPTPDMYKLVEAMRERLAGRQDVLVMGYGHVGDSNLHLNISAPRYDPALQDAIEPYVYEWVTQHNGSISAEHGLGLMKAGAIGYSKSPEAVEVMARLKKLFDPLHILNPYKVLPTAGIAGSGEVTA